MKIKEIKVLKLKLEGNDVKFFKQLIKKLVDTKTQIGFSSNSLNVDEIDIITKLNNKINP